MRIMAILGELREEREKLDRLIASIEEYASGRKRRGRPTNAEREARARVAAQKGSNRGRKAGNSNVQAADNRKKGEGTKKSRRTTVLQPVEKPQEVVSQAA